MIMYIITLHLTFLQLSTMSLIYILFTMFLDYIIFTMLPIHFMSNLYILYIHTMYYLWLSPQTGRKPRKHKTFFQCSSKVVSITPTLGQRLSFVRHFNIYTTWYIYWAVFFNVIFPAWPILLYKTKIHYILTCEVNLLTLQYSSIAVCNTLLNAP